MSKKKSARKYLEAGFNIIPTTKNKLPVIGNWRQYQKVPMSLEVFEHTFSDDHNIGLLTGGSTRIVCLDADMKYDLSGDLWQRFKEAVPKKILKKTMCQSTQNGGYHLVFKAPASRLHGNEKLAARYCTPEEQHQTYMEAFMNPETKGKALKIASADNSRILFETRSGSKDFCGGYFLIYPSEGYSHVYGKIGELDEEEYDILIETARSFNEVRDYNKPRPKEDYEQRWEVSPFEHYDKEGDIVSVLEDFGWTQLPQMGKNIRFRRPGKTHAASSAMFDVNTRIFNCFSTSTIFDVTKGYAPATIFTMLLHDGDQAKAFKALIDLGFGVPKKQ